MGGITVGGTEINVNGALAAIDTGTTAMLVPRAISDAINGAIPGAIRVVTPFLVFANSRFPPYYLSVDRLK